MCSMFVTVARRSTHPPQSPPSLDGQPLPRRYYQPIYLFSIRSTCIPGPLDEHSKPTFMLLAIPNDPLPPPPNYNSYSIVPNKPLVFICPPPHQPISPHVLLYMCILSIYSYIYYKNLHPSQKYYILSGTDGQDWKQESEHPPFLIM